MAGAIELTAEAALAHGSFHIGQIAVSRCQSGWFALSHREDNERQDLTVIFDIEQALELAKFDDHGNYRPLKTAPNLRHGWRMEVRTLHEVVGALEYFYPGRLAMLRLWQADQLRTTPVRATLSRQSGMYRVAANISDEQMDNVVAGFCRSDSGCLRTILWRRDAAGSLPSGKLPLDKFDPAVDQAERTANQPSSGQRAAPGTVIPLLCQEACNLLVAECRKAVKGDHALESLG